MIIRDNILFDLLLMLSLVDVDVRRHVFSIIICALITRMEGVYIIFNALN
jgi:hypothetical protein